MGGTCCKMEQTSPKLPFTEVISRCARMICPVDQQPRNPPHKRKLDHLGILGPMSKKDSWSQTDPLPPPRYRRRRKKERRRSRSAEFLPYLVQAEAAKSSSLEDLSGQEDVLDFQMYLGRLPKSSPEPRDDGKDSLSEKKKEFLSGLLGEENNNVILQGENTGDPSKLSPVLGHYSGEEPTGLSGSKKQDLEMQKSSDETQKEQDPDKRSCNSRKSSITESLREFECSLFDSLDEEDPPSLPPQPAKSLQDDQEAEEEDEEEVVKMMVPLKKAPFREDREDYYTISPIQEENEEEEENICRTLDNEMKTSFISQANDEFLEDLPDQQLSIENKNNIELKESNDKEVVKIHSKIIVDRVEDDARNRNLEKEFKGLTPKITVEIIS